MTDKNTNNKKKRRLDSNRIVLKAGESQRPNGTYCYRYRSRDGKTHAIYAKTLEEWRKISGLDKTSIHADPMFVDYKKGDFRLKPGSPAKGKGATL